MQQYKEFCKPKVAELLESLKLDYDFRSGTGNYLITGDGSKVLDLVGGFGSTILGHNHPKIKKAAIEALENDIAINAQGTIRTGAGELAQRLSDSTPGDKGYCVNFSNSGAESIEAAIKHSYKVHLEKINDEYERITRVLNDFFYKLESKEGEIEIPGNKSLIEFRDDLDEYNLIQFEAFQNNPVMLALKGSYHGKSASSVKITFNKSYREAFEGLSAIQTSFIGIDDVPRMKELVKEQSVTFYYPLLRNNKIEIRPFSMTKVIALAFEIVQGEGGIRPLSDSVLEQLVELHRTDKIPFIIDEIQTGCGRLGSVFGYSQTPLAKISPEYVALSKALGGGIAKIGATLIRKDIYEHDFGILHTSTFSEDDFSSKIALALLDEITRDSGEFRKTVEDRGNYLRGELNKLREKYPNIIKDVRGKGLMIGLEMSSLQARSPFFRATGKQGVLSLLMASYLLHYHKIRVLAPLTSILKGNPGKERLSIVRIQPPATITRDEIDSLLSGIDEVCNIVNCNNEYCLVAHLFGQTLTEDQRQNPKRLPVRFPVINHEHHIDARIGFVGHPTKLDHLLEYYFTSFEGESFDRKMLAEWWRKVSRFLEAVHVKCTYVTSNDFDVENNIILVPYLAEHMVTFEDNHLIKEVKDKIQDAVTIAKELGDENIPVSMVGLGAYTSIFSFNGQSLNDYEVPITTGNAYTTGLTIQGIMKAARIKGLEIGNSAIGVVGANGNIGKVVAQIFAPRAGKLVLIGRNGKSSAGRLEITRVHCIVEIIKSLRGICQQGDNIRESGVGKLGMAVYDVLTKLVENTRWYDGIDTEKQIFNLARKILSSPEGTTVRDLITLSTNFDVLKQIDIVSVSTNSPSSKLIRPEHVKTGAIVCGTSVPSNLSEEFENNSDYLAFDGGLALLPEGSEVDFVGMPKGSLAFGCLAETMVLGFDGQNHSYAKGELLPEQVYRVTDMADTYGFELGQLKLHDEVICSDEEIVGIAL